MSFRTQAPSLWHEWGDGQEAGVPVDRCNLCRVMRHMDGSNDDVLCVGKLQDAPTSTTTNR